jgi:hypothetical protein
MVGKKRIKTNKAEEVFYRLSFKPDFRNDLKLFRHKFDIPQNGFKNELDLKDWLAKRDKYLDKLIAKGKITNKDSKPIDMLDYLLSQIFILKKYKIPITSASQDVLENYILSNNKIQLPLRSENLCCEIITPEEIKLENTKQPFIELRIFDRASQSDVCDYVKDNWHFIKTILRLKKKDGQNGRIRKIVNKERNEIIFNLYRKTREELGIGRGEYKDIKISSIMKKEYGIEITPENIRKIISRQRKLRGM